MKNSRLLALGTSLQNIIFEHYIVISQLTANDLLNLFETPCAKFIGIPIILCRLYTYPKITFVKARFHP